MKYLLLLGAFTLASAACHSAQNVSPKKTSAMPTTVSSKDSLITPSGKTEIATLGGGCFWCVEAIFQDLQGVTKVESGYSGGHIDNPTYDQVCSGLSGHAEVIQITFDPAVVSFKEILEVFFTVHNPTTLNQQGADRGTQYRSVIYYHSPEQKAIAEESVATTAKELWDDPVVTEVSPFEKFFKAESYHQNYYKDNPNQGYCSFVIAPKIKKFREKYKDKLKQ